MMNREIGLGIAIVFGIVMMTGIMLAIIILRIESKHRRKIIERNNSARQYISQLLMPLFTAEECNAYVYRMAMEQPLDNDRVLPGCGKEHTLKIMVSNIDCPASIPSLRDQMGEMFS